MTELTAKEISVILQALENKYGLGYSTKEDFGVKIGALQAKLSLMAELAIEKATIKQKSNKIPNF
jgi:hypothetical protein